MTQTLFASFYQVWAYERVLRKYVPIARHTSRETAIAEAKAYAEDGSYVKKVYDGGKSETVWDSLLDWGCGR